MGYPLPQDGFDTYASTAIDSGDSVIYLNEVPEVYPGVLTIFEKDGITVAEKVYYTAVDEANSRVTGVVRSLRETASGGEILFTTDGSTPPDHPSNVRVAMTDNINYTGLALAILNGDMEVGGKIKAPSSRVFSDPREYIDKEYADSISAATLTAFAVTDNGGITVNVGSGYYAVNGYVALYAGASNQSLTDDSVNYVQFKDRALDINVSGFDADAIPLAKVTTVSGDITVIEDSRAFFTVVDLRTETNGSLVCGAAGDTTPANWAAVSDGEITVTIDDVEYDITSIDFTGDTTMDEVAATLQAAIRAATSSTETCVYDTDHFVITSAVTGYVSEISVLSDPSAGGTYIGGASWMNGESGTGVATQGLGTGLARSSAGLYIDLESIATSHLKTVNGKLRVKAEETGSGVVIKTRSDSKIDPESVFYPNYNEDDFVLGETIDGTTTPVCVYMRSADGKLLKTDASSRGDDIKNFVGLVVNSGGDGDNAALVTGGIVTVPTITLQTTISSEIDQFQADRSGGDRFEIDSTADWFSQLIAIGDQVGYISSIKIWTTIDTGAPTAKVDIYAADADGKPTGSSLRSSSTATVVDGDYTEFTFSAPYTQALPGQVYCFVVKGVTVSAGVNDFFVETRDANDDLGYNIIKAGSDTGYTYVAYNSTNSGSVWNHDNPCQFETYTTQRQIMYGDPVFLSETGGEYTTVRPTTSGSAVKKIGRILSATKIKLEQRERVYLGSVRATCSTDNSAYIAAPAQAEEAIIQISDYVDAGDTDMDTREVILRRNEKTIALPERYNTTAGNQDSVITCTWDGNVVTIVGGADAILYYPKVYFYT